MPNIGQEYPNCRYWGFEPALAEEARKGNMEPYGSSAYLLRKEAIAKARQGLKDLQAMVKTAGYKPSRMGLSKSAATREAAALEGRFPGIVWNVFNHDYL